MSVIEQPLADAIHYQNNDVVKLLEARGAKLPVCPSVLHIYNWMFCILNLPVYLA